MPVDEALAQLEALTEVLPPEVVPVSKGVGRVLAHPFSAAFDLPPFARSAMDGYGLRATDVQGASAEHPVRLPLRDDVWAGTTPKPLPAGAACRIATGGALPPGADAVVRQEDVAVDGAGHVLVTRAVPAGKDVVGAGEYARQGQRVLPAGWRLGANDVALLAAFGAGEVGVVRRPRVAYVETGDELVRPGPHPGGPVGPMGLPVGRIYASNNVMLTARGRLHGGRVVAATEVPDEFAAMLTVFQTLAEQADVVVSTGGVSVGEKDLVLSVLQRLGGQLLFQGLPIRPGHPVSVVRLGRTWWFALPGNPAAALITHEVLTRPVLWRLGGQRFAQGFNPSWRPPVTGSPLQPRPRVSFYLGRLQYDNGKERVVVDRDRRPTALPGPFPFDVLVRVDPLKVIPQHRTDPPQEPVPSPGQQEQRARPSVYPVQIDVAESRFNRFPWDVEGVLLAGGASRRMGRSKLLLPLQGMPLLVRAYRALRAVSRRVRVVGAPPEAVDALVRWEGGSIRADCVEDERPGEGPLAGLATGLRATQAPFAFVLAVDLPTVGPRALTRLLEAAALEAPGLTGDPASVGDGFVLAHGGRRQPLAGLYPTAAALSVADALLSQGRRAVQLFADTLGVREVPEPEPLLNVNRPEDYVQAQTVFQGVTGQPLYEDSQGLGGEFAQDEMLGKVRPPMLGFAGHSGSGKTTIIERVILRLKEQGMRVAVLKQGRHFQLDRPGKDSWRYKQAGADQVLLYSPEQYAHMGWAAGPMNLPELVGRVGPEADVVLVEGFKREAVPKVAVLRPDETWAHHPLFADPDVVAVYGPVAPDESAAPVFSRSSDGLEQVVAWAVTWLTKAGGRGGRAG